MSAERDNHSLSVPLCFPDDVENVMGAAQGNGPRHAAIEGLPAALAVEQDHPVIAHDDLDVFDVSPASRHTDSDCIGGLQSGAEQELVNTRCDDWAEPGITRDKWLGSLRSIFLFCGGDISKLPPEQTPEAGVCSA